MEENVKTEKKKEKQPEVNQEKVKRPSLLKRVRRFLGGILSDLADLFKGLGHEIPEPFERQAKAQKRKHIGLFGLVRKIINTMFKIAGRMLKPLVRSYSDMNAAKQKVKEQQTKMVDGKPIKTVTQESVCPSISKKKLLQEKQLQFSYFLERPQAQRPLSNRKQSDGRGPEGREISTPVKEYLRSGRRKI